MLNKMELSKFVLAIKEKWSLHKTLLMDLSEFSLFSKLDNEADLIFKIHEKGENEKIKYGDPLLLLDGLKQNFDLIVGDLPFGWMKEEYKNPKKNIDIKERKNWIVILRSLYNLSENGKGIYLVEPLLLNSQTGANFIDLLNKRGFYIESVFNIPENILKPATGLRPIIVVISKEKKNKIFVAEIEENSDINRVLENKNKGNSVSLAEGMFLDTNFRGFEKYKISKQLDKLSKLYKDFKKYSLKELSNEINIRNRVDEKDNSIYIPKVGTLKTTSDLKKVSVKHQNLIQIVLDKNLVKSEYLSLFFNSKIGKLNLKSLFSGTVIPHINKADVENLLVSVPSIELQNKVIESDRKLNQLKLKIDSFEEEIALNPKSVESIEKDLTSMLDSLDMLKDSDKILSLIREGESKTLEFKSTLRKSIEKEGVPDSVIEKATLKNIAGFMNSAGGILLVGVNDEGEILGLNNDDFESNDDILKHVKNLIKRDFGPEFYDLINYKIISVEDKKVLHFECKPSKKPVFLGKDEEFYVRTNPATDKLSGKKQYEYIETHFGGISK